VNDITGNRYGMLVVIKKSHKNTETRWLWECLCDCGNTTYAAKNALDYGAKKSCGCIVGKNHTHGMRSSPEYSSWLAIKSRCLNHRNKDFARYGGAGITICQSWHAFEVFYKDMGPRQEGTQIDRIDNTKGYSKNNCRWATPKQQACNRRHSKIWNIKGILFDSAMDAAIHYGVSDTTIHRWCKGGDRTISRPDCHCEGRYLL